MAKVRQKIKRSACSIDMLKMHQVNGIIRRFKARNHDETEGTPLYFLAPMVKRLEMQRKRKGIW